LLSVASCFFLRLALLSEEKSELEIEDFKSKEAAKKKQ
jgi:hypothetical protein